MRKLVSLALVLAMVCTMSVTAFAEDTSISDQSQEQSATCEVVYDLQTQYCVIIPERIYANDGTYYFNAQYMYLRDTEQLSIYISPLKDPGMVTVSRDNGDTLDLCVHTYVDGLGDLSEDGLVAVFTKSNKSDCGAYFEKIYDGKTRSAGMYSGTFEFTIKIEERK